MDTIKKIVNSRGYSLTRAKFCVNKVLKYHDIKLLKIESYVWIVREISLKQLQLGEGVAEKVRTDNLRSTHLDYKRMARFKRYE